MFTEWSSQRLESLAPLMLLQTTKLVINRNYSLVCYMCVCFPFIFTVYLRCGFDIAL